MHTCFNCGEAADDYEMFTGSSQKIWLCGEHECHREKQREHQGIKDEARHRAEEDDYDRYR